ncbi:heme oxygenase [Methylobacterium sp. Leaf456]|uniref:biliverdin-producing heme oxygenase n=1 Tax=Methylobacterium sp. Leaf456 TaxID=1736382 RepID=UPI0006FB0AF5|nr:biliverdin-producing heme oxygenase [Methylobacterium sp. Leaf456]KQT61157.1 heme oxygenase [Methylobacterium sp. Leaf456]
MQTGLHIRLRAATAEPHEALERDLDWQGKVATLPGYRALLARLRGFHAAYEPAIALGLSDEAFFAPRRRLAALDADLSALGLDFFARTALPAPPAPRLEGEGAAMGALYVLEGSTLGGLVIGRHVGGLHGDGVPLAYYSGRGREAGPLWRTFRERLDGLASTQEGAAFAAGVATFEAMRVWLTTALAV